MLIRPGFFRKNVVVCQRNERKTENGRRRQNFGEILVKTLKNRNTGLFEPIGGCGPTNMTNGGGMNMVVLKNYKIKEQNGMYYIVPSSVPGCPQCGGEMKIRDSKRRKVIFADGTVDTFVLRRYKCTVCGRVHLELPDIMVPHKHYSRSAIIDTINGERNCSAEQSTIYRWNREKMQLERLLVQVEDKSPEAKRTTVIITAGAQEIKYEKAAGELPVKGEMKKQQVNCLQRGK